MAFQFPQLYLNSYHFKLIPNQCMTKDNRPDFSKYLAHFTTERPPMANDVNNPTVKITKGKSAYERLISILDGKKIISSSLPWTGRKAVCLTECPWTSLIDHSKKYSAYGIGFNKPFVFGAGGGPAYYVRKDHYDKQEWENDLLTFVTPFWLYISEKLTTQFRGKLTT
jgi:hypothetical protein